MNIMMFTNTYAPLVGGVSNSVQRFSRLYRELGHRVLVVAPSFGPNVAPEYGVVRVPAIRQFNGTDFSMALPIPGLLRKAVAGFQPDVIHAHHPFLLGETALRVAETHDLPIVFTHHTLYEEYTHYLSRSLLETVINGPARMKRFASELATGYANLCDAVIAPSESLADLIRERGVAKPIHVIPTGVDTHEFSGGDAAAGRARLGIPEDAFVVGHVGRLATEKNLEFLARALARFAVRRPRAHIVVAGDGPARSPMVDAFRRAGMGNRAHFPGMVSGAQLTDLYQALDAFAFASHTETQGMVLTEALAAGVPVVAVDAPGVREVLADGRGGRLLKSDDERGFADALDGIACLPREQKARLREQAAQAATSFGIAPCSERALAVYHGLAGTHHQASARQRSLWLKARARIEADWKLLANLGRAARSALQAGDA